MLEFLKMGGYAEYVWPAYCISAAVLIALGMSIWMKSRTLSKKLKDLAGDPSQVNFTATAEHENGAAPESRADSER